jgi:hypothetical protein
MTGRNESASQQHVAALDDVSFLRRGRCQESRGCLPGQSRRIDPQLQRFDQAAIGGNVVALLQENKVTYDQVLYRNLGQKAVPKHLCFLWQEPLQCCQSLLNAMFLPKRK